MSVQWRPMEDAPRDGTEVIVETRSTVRVLAHYQPGGFCIEDHPAGLAVGLGVSVADLLATSEEGAGDAE